MINSKIHMRSDEKGYSLIEALVSLVLLMAILLPLTHYSSLHLFQRRAKNDIIALMLAQQTIEEALSSPERLPSRKREGVWDITSLYRLHQSGFSVKVQVRRNNQLHAQLVALLPSSTLLKIDYFKPE